MRAPLTIIAILVVQFLCAVFFVSDIVFTLLGIRVRPINWEVRELLEIGASLGLILGVVLGAMALRRSLRETAVAREKLQAVSSAFMDLLHQRFDEWGLTPAEKDVAMFSIKGFSTQEIAGFRNTSEGTVKAQTNAIYRKAGVNGRAQLLGLFIEDLIDAPAPDQVAEAEPPVALTAD